MEEDHRFRQFGHGKRARHVAQGVAVITLMAPLDRMKILMQVSSASKTITAAGGYRSLSHTFAQCCQKQGYASLWRGYSASLLTHFPSVILASEFSPWFRSRYDSRDKFRHFKAGVTSGAASGVLATSLFYPLHFCRTRLAADIGGKIRSDREFTSLYNCAKTIVAQDGFRGLYRGLFIAIQGIVLHRALYFGLYESWTASTSRLRRNFFAGFLAGQGLSLFCSLVTYPFDLVHRQMQMQSGHKHRVYENAIRCIKTIAAKEGIRGFYRGLLPSLIAGGLTSSIYVVISFTRHH